MDIKLEERLAAPGVIFPETSPTIVPKGLIDSGLEGHYQKSRKRHLHHNKKLSTWRRNALAWLRDHIHAGIPQAYYNLVLGHDLHVSVYAELYVRHFHYGQLDPFTNKLEFHQVKMNGVLQTVPGWWENIGLVSRRKVTDAFVTFEIATLVLTDSEYADFQFHRVGTSAAAEDNNHTALTTDAGITGVSGTQVDVDPIYRTVATVTADATETWQEHGIFSQAGTTTPLGTMMDRSLITPNVSVVASDTVEFTYELTKNPEA
ncbi:hypothetical protein LCGC14_0442490 [marine sediment metagenome]|uniref:Uncharacterized protein n=1 Tax=marine sediment metagenome TaxID=412755 RepID=A0A0F9SQQ8_9ZZZZ